MTVIQTSAVTVRYGKRTAVDDVSLAVPEGSVYALLGRNGAGKSSLVRCLLGQLRPDHGRVELFGEDVWSRRAKLMDRVGIVAEEPDAPAEMRVADLAAFSAKLYSRWEHVAFDERLERFAISPKSRFGELSKGQRKQVTLALALAGTPELLILDDPTLGLDVVARKSLFEEVIADMADHGITVLITTHDLAAVESIADRVGVLRAGRLVLDEEMETVKSRFRKIRVAGQAETLGRFETMNVRTWGSGTEAVVTNYDASVSVPNADVAPMSLEEIFIALAGEGR
jgi:ABC-2 type transport system ATP-binding protein